MQEILFRGRRTLLIGATILLLAAMSPSAVRSAPTTINFEHRGNGIAWVGNNISVPVNEYANQGVLITADLGAINPGRASLFLNNGNIGTVNIHGYAISHGATAGADTFLNFQFSSHVIDLAFDWSSSTVASGIIVSL